MDAEKARDVSRRILLLTALGATLVTVALALFRPPFFARIESQVYDIVLRAAGTSPPASNIAIIDVDERSLAAVGQWPWRRDEIARLIAQTRALGAKVVALDVIFAEEDRFESAGGGGRPDAILADTLRDGRTVVGYAMTFDSPRSLPSTCVLHPLPLAVVQPPNEVVQPPVFEATGVICTLPALAEAAGASGFLNAAPDPDGILRRVPLAMEFGERVYPSLAVAAILAATDPGRTILRSINVNTASLTLGNRTVPLDGRGNLLLRFRGKKKTFLYASAADVLQGRMPSAAFRDAIVFVGATALGTREVVSTPLDTLFAGVEVQATVADNLLQQDYLRRTEHASTIEALAVVGTGVAIAILIARSGLIWGGAGIAVILVALWAIAGWSLSSRGQFVSPLYPTIGLLGALAAATVAKLTQERGRAEREAHDKTLAQRLMVQSLLSLTEVRDAETGLHSRRTQRYARLLAGQLATHPRFHDYLTPVRIDLLASLAPLHDIGKVGVPDQLLNKPGALTREELSEMRRHPSYGLDVITKAEQLAGSHDDAILKLAKDIVYTHHERWDGTGYPQGLKGEQIPIAGRVMALVDVYDALISKRRYRQPMPHEVAVDLIVQGRGTQFDPAVVDAFVNVATALRDVPRDDTVAQAAGSP